jgi:hypothetical protein
MVDPRPHGRAGRVATYSFGFVGPVIELPARIPDILGIAVYRR